jgi:hypothetical protein
MTVITVSRMQKFAKVNEKINQLEEISVEATVALEIE